MPSLAAIWWRKFLGHFSKVMEDYPCVAYTVWVQYSRWWQSIQQRMKTHYVHNGHLYPTNSPNIQPNRTPDSPSLDEKWVLRWKMKSSNHPSVLLLWTTQIDFDQLEHHQQTNQRIKKPCSNKRTTHQNTSKLMKRMAVYFRQYDDWHDRRT